MCATAFPRQKHEPRPCRFSVDAAENGMRLDAFLSAKLKESGLSREKIKRLIHEGNVRLDSRFVSSPSTRLSPGNLVEALVSFPPTSLAAEEGDMDVLYQDAALAVINKPAGLTVHPSPGRADGTLAHRLLARFPELAAQEGFRPGIVHRLDKDTSGLMLVALNEQSRLALAALFARHEVYKEYLALVRGVPARSEENIEAPIGRHPTRKTRMAVLTGGRPARSVRRTLYADPQGRFALEAVRIFSGRTHQVRVHMQHAGHPLLGDDLYAAPPPSSGQGRKKKRLNEESGNCQDPGAAELPPLPARQMLHAWKLAFAHPRQEALRPDALPENASLREGIVSFLLPPPEDFTELARSLARRCLRVVITGSPGCGKSALLHLLQQAGLPVFSADAEVGRLYLPGADGHRLLRQRFGNRFVPDGRGPVDKISLGAAFRDDVSLRREVEALLHPLVYHALEEFWLAHERRRLAVAEVPLYLESVCAARRESRESRGMDEPVLIGVHCPFPLREKRLLEKRGWSRELAARMESWQWPEEKKMRACAIVVPNTGTLDELAVSCGRLLERLHSLAEERAESVLRSIQALWNGNS